MKLQVIIVKVEGEKEDDYHYYATRGSDVFWTTRLKEATFFDEEAAAWGAFDHLKRSMEVHTGKDLKTGEPILDPRTKKPITRIDLPLHIFHLARPSAAWPATEPEKKVSIHIVDMKIELDPTENFISFKVRHPSLPKED